MLRIKISLPAARHANLRKVAARFGTWPACYKIFTVRCDVISRYVEGFTRQPPKPLNHPRQPHQNFLDFSKSLEKSKNFPDYRESSKYREYHIISSKL